MFIDDIEELYEEMIDEINSIQYSDIINTNENILTNIFNIRRYIELNNVNTDEDSEDNHYNIYNERGYDRNLYNNNFERFRDYFQIQSNLQTSFLNSIIEILFGDNLNQNVEDVKVTLTEEEFNKFNNIKLTKENFEKYNTQCNICIDDYKIEDIIIELSCKHLFHKECIKSWLCKENISCPVCRTDCRNKMC
jgi:hypothetical protein